MEQRMRICHSRRGVALVTVLFITGIGLLFGAGALLIFRYQCQLRVDRQHEMEKVYAVRSALNYIGKNADKIAAAKIFECATGSGRDLDLIVKPSARIFPNPTNENHFVMEDGVFGQGSITKDNACGYCRDYNYEYGASPEISKVAISNLPPKKVNGEVYRELEFLNPEVLIGARCWLNIGMSGEGTWLKTEYGRRYYFYSYEIIEGDTVRLWIIRDCLHSENALGCQHGWPLAENEKALVFQITCSGKTGSGQNEKINATMTLSEYWGNVQQLPPLISWTESIPTQAYMGMQLAERKVSLFYVDRFGLHTKDNEELNGFNFWPKFPDSREMSDDVYMHFKEPEGADLRAVIEVVAGAASRPSTAGDPPLAVTAQNLISKFRVTPAYQYDVFVVSKGSSSPPITNLATVAQTSGKYATVHGSASYPSVFTYDTHGTENKGFRKDEREAARRQQGQ